MSKPLPIVDGEALDAALTAGRIVPLSRENWAALAGRYAVEEEVPTGMTGSILLIRGPGPMSAEQQEWALVERPEKGLRVVRPMASEAEARALIAHRLDAYERMWDG